MTCQLKNHLKGRWVRDLQPLLRPKCHGALTVLLLQLEWLSVQDRASQCKNCIQNKICQNSKCLHPNGKYKRGSSRCRWSMRGIGTEVWAERSTTRPMKAKYLIRVTRNTRNSRYQKRGLWVRRETKKNFKSEIVRLRLGEEVDIGKV